MTDHDAWHPSPRAIKDYADGAAGPVAVLSTEAHLLACPTCRATIVATRADAAADATWLAITDRIDEPRHWSHRRSGDHLVGLTLVSPTMRRLTVALIIVLTAAPALAAFFHPRGATTVLMLLAPLAPLAAAVSAYRSELDPAGALSGATPAATSRLVLVRAMVVTSVSLVAGLISTLALPVPATAVLAWLLPGLALCSVVLAAGTRFEPTKLAIALAAGWVGAVVVWTTRSSNEPVDAALDRFAVERLGTQLALLAVVVVCAAIFHVRRHEIPRWRLT